PFCEESVEHFVSQSCWKGEISQNKSSAYILECKEGYLNQSCETYVNECSPKPCQNVTDCIDIPTDIMCMFSPICTVKHCKQLQTPLESFPCKINATSMKYEKDYHCSCIPGFTGKNCEKVIDRCRLFTINCLNEGWCFNVIGRFRYICTPGCTRNSCRFVKNICLIHLNACYCGAISHGIFQAEVASPPQLKYVWQLKFTGSEGENHEVVTGSYFFLACSCMEGAVSLNRSKALGHVCWFLREGTRKICANGCSWLIKEDDKGYWCLCTSTWFCKMCLENTTDYEGSRCQQATYEEEINISR
ncbi:hypothetical protein DBR06_SOUSAS9510027, partial [Sousa chinensis]